MFILCLGFPWTTDPVSQPRGTRVCGCTVLLAQPATVVANAKLHRQQCNTILVDGDLSQHYKNLQCVCDGLGDDQSHGDSFGHAPGQSISVHFYCSVADSDLFFACQ